MAKYPTNESRTNDGKELFVHLQQRVFALALCSLAALLLGCGGEKGMGQVSGKVTVDGQIPAAGSSITFFPTEGSARSAGALLVDGNYSVSVPTGESRVEIRIPRPVVSEAPVVAKKGPGSDAGSGMITESLPKKYNDDSELKLKVVGGENKKDWEVSTKP